MKITPILVAGLFYGSSAFAATTGVKATFSGDENVPTLTIENTGDLGDIINITLLVGLAGTHGIDGWANPVVGAGIVPTYNPNDFNLNGGGQYDIVLITFTGFTPGNTFAVDFDVDLNASNTNEDYRTDVLPGGFLTVGFSGGLATGFTGGLTPGGFGFDLTPTSTTQSSYEYADSVASAIPLPAGLPLMLTALGGAVFLARRKRA